MVVSRARPCWVEHVLCMEDNRLSRSVLYGEILDARRKHGGQWKRYKDILHENHKSIRMSDEEWGQLASNRREWRVHQRRLPWIHLVPLIGLIAKVKNDRLNLLRSTWINIDMSLMSLEGATCRFCQEEEDTSARVLCHYKSLARLRFQQLVEENQWLIATPRSLYQS